MLVELAKRKTLPWQSFLRLPLLPKHDVPYPSRNGLNFTRVLVETHLSLNNRTNSEICMNLILRGYWPNGKPLFMFICEATV